MVNWCQCGATADRYIDIIHNEGCHVDALRRRLAREQDKGRALALKSFLSKMEKRGKQLQYEWKKAKRRWKNNKDR